MQNFSDDATHDEALSSRIAAVNILDLTLAHLGVEVGESAEPVGAVIKACGESEFRISLLSVAARLMLSNCSTHSAGSILSCSR